MTGAPLHPQPAHPAAPGASATERLARLAMIAGVVGISGAVLAAGLAPLGVHTALLGALFALLYLLGIPLGAGALLMVHELTGGRWGWSVRLALRAQIATLPVALLLLAPLAAGAVALYPWTSAAYVAQHHLVQEKAVWLNLPFWLGRMVLFAAIWLAGAVALLGATRPRFDSGGDLIHTRHIALASLGAIVYTVTMTFGAWDWFASLEPRWYSSIFGAQLIVGQALTALAATSLVAAIIAGRTAQGREHGLEPDRLHDLGNLMLAGVILHAYMSFVQYFIIWNGDVEATVLWYIPRLEWPWLALALGIMSLHFFMPMVALFFRRGEAIGARAGRCGGAGAGRPRDRLRLDHAARGRGLHRARRPAGRRGPARSGRTDHRGDAHGMAA
jgi:hypothetical protein